jgi:hypothetical protein
MSQESFSNLVSNLQNSTANIPNSTEGALLEEDEELEEERDGDRFGDRELREGDREGDREGAKSYKVQAKVQAVQCVQSAFTDFGQADAAGDRKVTMEAEENSTQKRSAIGAIGADEGIFFFF